MEVFENLKANLVGKNARIVLPEGEDPRILQATKRAFLPTRLALRFSKTSMSFTPFNN